MLINSVSKEHVSNLRMMQINCLKPKIPPLICGYNFINDYFIIVQKKCTQNDLNRFFCYRVFTNSFHSLEHNLLETYIRGSLSLTHC